MRDHVVDPSLCPHCGQVQDGALNTQDDDRPHEGAVSVCFSCQGLSIFTQNLDKRLPTPEEQEELDANPYIQKVRLAAKLVMDKHRG